HFRRNALLRPEARSHQQRRLSTAMSDGKGMPVIQDRKKNLHLRQSTLIVSILRCAGGSLIVVTRRLHLLRNPYPTPSTSEPTWYPLFLPEGPPWKHPSIPANLRASR